LVNSKIIERAINNPNLIDDNLVSDLSQLVKKYPYFQTAHILLSKAMNNIDSVRFNSKIKKAAAYSSNRKILFKIISDKSNLQNNQEKEKNYANKQSLEFSQNEMHSFNEWLTITKASKINRLTSKDDKLIKNFISLKPSVKIKKDKKFFKSVDIAKNSLKENTDLITETLARVYLEQEHFNKAINAYEKLKLKFPQKSTLFAEQIKLIIELKNK
tara:strand:+ start:5275 stop:5919 length:645 start_codon:yes stop_codon:yes gene_type:complete